jgi:N-acetyl-D-muramate 6-phosphate phosphatase
VKQRPAALLFDLDGTLIDSAPDLAGTANDMLHSRGLAQLPYAELRPAAGSGARGMLGTAFQLNPGDPGYSALRDEFHDRYEQRMLLTAMVFPGIKQLLEVLSAQGLPWGIVTNKARRFAQPMVQGLLLMPSSGVLVCGDCTPHTKPHPAPLFEAARRMGVPANACAYVGDDLRDVQAARAAGMRSLAAAWGYLGHGAEIAAWGADGLLDEPQALLHFFDLA